MNYELSPLGNIFLVIGVVLFLINAMRLVISAFRVHVVWGLVILLIPGLGLAVFIIRHWMHAGTYFLNCILAILFILFILTYYPGIENGIHKGIIQNQADWDRIT